MLEKGSSATTYEPYQGNTYNIDLPVENLFNKETAQLNVGINTSNGNTYGDTNLFSTDYIPISINTTYRANSASTTGNRVFGACYDSNKSFLEAVSTGVGERIFTVTNANAKYVRITGQKVNIDTYQLEKGSKANSYTPFGTTPIELCKIGDYQDYFGKSDGRNLFDKSTITTSAYLKEDGTLQTGTGAEYITSDFIPVKPNTTYYKTQTLSPRTKFYDKNKQVLDSSTYQDISIGGNAGSFTTPNNAYYFRFTGNVNASTGININTTMVNEGSSALPYQPYGVGKWYLHKEIGKKVYDGSEYFGYGASGETGISVINTGGIGMKQGNYLGGKSNYFMNNQSGKLVNTIRFGANDTNIWIYISSSDFTSANDFKTWVSTHNTIVYFVLETPTNTEITYQPLIDQLNLLEKAMSKDSQTNISQVNNDLGFVIYAEAIKSLENVLDRLDLLES